MRGTVRFGFLVLGLSSLTALAGCTQGEGDRCEVDADCDVGLVCKSAGSVGDVPELVCTSDSTPVASADAAPNQTSTPDGGVDVAPIDAALSDAAPADVAPTDAAASDAGGPDAVAPDGPAADAPAGDAAGNPG